MEAHGASSGPLVFPHAVRIFHHSLVRLLPRRGGVQDSVGLLLILDLGFLPSQRIRIPVVQGLVPGGARAPIGGMRGANLLGCVGHVYVIMACNMGGRLACGTYAF